MRPAATIAGFLAVALATPARAACHLALVLALDVSTSVDAREYALQRDGLAAALNSPAVRTALFSGPETVAITVYEWSGRVQQTRVLDWVHLRTPGDLDQAVARIRGARRSFDAFRTAMGHALIYGAGLFDAAPVCARHTIDISGDGYNNDGMDPPAAYRNPVFAGITVNGLVVGTADHRVPIYYATEVIRGPDAFIEKAESYAEFEVAMRRKLLREIGTLVLGKGPSSRPETGG